MKKIFTSIALVAVAAASLVSCNKEVKPVEPVEKEYTYTFSLSNPDTKAYLDLNDAVTKWETGDQLGVYTVGTHGTSYNRYGNINSSETPVKFQISSYYALGAGDRVYCYFPYDENNKNGDARNPAKVNLSIPTQQNGKMNAMPMVSVPYTMTKAVAEKTDEPIADINMRNLGGVFQFNIFSSNAEYQTETIESVEFNANAAIAGSFVYDITQEELSAISGLAETSITVDEQSLAIAASKETASKVLMVVAPGTHNGSLVVTTDVAIYTLDFSSAKTIERSHVKPLNVNLANASRELRPFDPTGSVTKTMSDVVSENGYTVSSGSSINTIATEIVLDGVVTMSTTGQANCGSFWGTAPNIEWRLYQNKSGNLILTLAEGYKMTSVTFVYSVGNNGLLKYGETNLSSNVAFTGIKGQSSATFNVSASSGKTGQVKLTAVTVAYTSGEIEKDDATWAVDPSSITVMEGKTATAVFTTDYDGSLNIVSNDPETATVSVEGTTITVSGVKEGSTTISVSGEATAAYKAIAKTIDVTVEKKALVDPTVTIDSEVTVVENETKELSLTTNYDGEIHVSSAAVGTATVVYEGGKVKISGVAAGSTTVTVSGEATSEYNAFSKDIAVTVEAAPTDIVYLYESFNSVSGEGGNDGKWSGLSTTASIENTDNNGWSFTRGFPANKCARFGTSSGLGSAITPELDIKTSSAVLKFKAGAWGTADNTTLKLSITSGSATMGVPSVTMSNSAWTTYKVDLANISGKIKIKFEGNSSSDSRFFLDEVEVYYGTEPEHPVILKSLEWTGYKNSYEKDEPFSIDGTIKAIYDDGNKVTLDASDVELTTAPDMSTVGDTEAVISYTSGTVTKTATAYITITNPGQGGDPGKPAKGTVLYEETWGTSACAVADYKGAGSTTYNDASTLSFSTTDAKAKIDATANIKNCSGAHVYINGKKNATGYKISVAGIKTYGAKKVKVTFGCNNTATSVKIEESSTTALQSADSAENSKEFDLTGSEETITLQIWNNANSNTRSDNFKITFEE